ncbi:hypothetical protein JYT80_00140 [bacterium AH-315-I11]|nr:hypothetical protein [bacterium AH-315-I11]MBN4059727.1 hypothetical protein [bacterium AH-315-I11]
MIPKTQIFVLLISIIQFGCSTSNQPNSTIDILNEEITLVYFNIFAGVWETVARMDSSLYSTTYSDQWIKFNRDELLTHPDRSIREMFRSSEEVNIEKCESIASDLNSTFEGREPYKCILVPIIL